MAAKIKLLIVDDETRFLNTLTQRLSLRDFAVTPVENGQAAIEAAEREEFDLALVDLKMPGMSGEEVLETLKRQHPLLEVVILTGHGSIDSAVFCTMTGSHSYLQKPCGTEELLKVLMEAYQKRVKRKLQIDQEKLESMLGLAMGESPLGILRRLREIERGEEEK
jgi:two-component system NtrC family response regulator